MAILIINKNRIMQIITETWAELLIMKWCCVLIQNNYAVIWNRIGLIIAVASMRFIKKITKDWPNLIAFMFFNSGLLWLPVDEKQ